jgi:hypothetical protein
MPTDATSMRLILTGVVLSVAIFLFDLMLPFGVNVEVLKVPAPLPEDIALYLYRVAQKCLRNVANTPTRSARP